MDSSATKPIIEQIRLYRTRAKFYRSKAAENEKLAAENEKIAASWESVLSQVQALQRQEQPAGMASQLTLPELQDKVLNEASNRFEFARRVLLKYRDDGILPVDIRKLANAQGFAVPSNYPYKLLTNLVKQGKARKDHQTGRYFPIEQEGKSED